jgi:hypothetical protein
LVTSFTSEAIENVVTAIATRVNGQVWKSAALSKLIDDIYGKSPLVAAQFLDMEKQVNYLCILNGSYVLTILCCRLLDIFSRSHCFNLSTPI